MKYLLLLTALLSGPVLAQDAAVPTKFMVADGSGNKAYHEIWIDFMKFCNSSNTGLDLSEVPSAGSVDNLSKLLENKATAAFTRTDVILYHDMTEKLSGRVQTLLALYSEEVHFIALRESKAAIVKDNGKWKKNTTQVLNFDSVGDLRGRKVGAFEGSVLSATLINLKTNADYTVVSYNKPEEVKAALDNGDIDAWVTVGGAPLGNIASLDGKTYKLLAIPESFLPRLQDIYKTAHITYPNLDKDPITTVASDALLVTRKYKTPKMVGALGRLRSCFYKHLDELKEEPGTHSKWAEIEADYQGKWVWLDLPTDPDSGPTKPVATPVSTKKRIK